MANQGAPAELLPAPAAAVIDFHRDVQPIIEASCLRCHGEERPRSGFRLTDRESALAGGDGGPAIRVHESENSPLIQYVSGLVDDMLMPPSGRGERLTAEQIAILRAWIDQGVPWPEEPAIAHRVVESSIGIQTISVNGNEQKFRADTWLNDGWSGGLERFIWEEDLPSGRQVTVEGRGLAGQADYGLSLKLQQRDLGKFQVGVDSTRKYFNDVGGLYPPWDIPAPRLDRDLSLDLIRSWVEIGLDRPKLPQLTLGYQHELSEGERPTLQWGQTSPQPSSVPAKAVVPNTKKLREEVHRLRFDASYAVPGLSLADHLQAEWSRLDTTRSNRGSGDPGVQAEHREGTSEFRFANALQAEKEMRKGWLVAGGYLYTRREGEGVFEQQFSSLTSAFPPSLGDRSDEIVVEYAAHAGNLSTQVQVSEPFVFWAGLQGEAQRQRGFTALISPAFPSPVTGQYVADLDRYRFDQTAGVRFQGIPYTVVEANARWQQDWTDHIERGLLEDGFDDSRDFLRDTDATSRMQDYETSLTVSPWPRISFGSGYRYRRSKSHYDHLTDTDGSQLPFGIPGNGYPAFIGARQVAAQEVNTRLVWRASPWLKLTLKHQWIDSTYRSNTKESLVPALPAPIFYPGGELLSGQRRDHVYSLNVAWTPYRRWYTSGSITYTDAESVSGVTGNSPALTPYAGEVVTILGHSSYRINAKTDLAAGYTYSRAHYRQDNEPEGLPLGIRFDRHGFTAGLTRRWSERLSMRLDYAFYHYSEPSSGRANNYQAHAVALSLHYVFANAIKARSLIHDGS